MVGTKREGFLERTFKLKENGTDVKTEVLAGITGKGKEVHWLVYILCALFIK